MKRLILATSLVFVVNVPAAIAMPPTQAHVRTYLSKYHEVRSKFGTRAPGCKLVGRNATCHQKATDALVVKSTRILERMLVVQVILPSPKPCWDVNTCGSQLTSSHTSTSQTQSTPTPQFAEATSSSSSSGYGNVPGVPSSFASCVAMRESTNGAGSSNIYGIEGPGGQGSLSEQKAAFSQMYASRGTEPWAPYDGC